MATCEVCGNQYDKTFEVVANNEIEHAAASAENMLQAALLIVLLGFPLLAISMPAFTVWEVHPVSALMVAGYVFGMRKVAETRDQPMWTPLMTSETRKDIPDERFVRAILSRIWTRFILYALILGLAGWAVA